MWIGAYESQVWRTQFLDVLRKRPYELRALEYRAKQSPGTSVQREINHEALRVASQLLHCAVEENLPHKELSSDAEDEVHESIAMVLLDVFNPAKGTQDKQSGATDD